MREKLKLLLGGVLTGAVNALLGAGGGLIAVPILKKCGANQKQAQATAVSIILPLTAISAAVYCLRGSVALPQALPYLPMGFVGALMGAFLLKKAPNKLLKKAFALLLIYSGVRMILK